MPFLCRDHDLHHFPQFSKPIEDAANVAQFVRDELLRHEEKLRTLSEFGMTAWIDDDFGAFYLEVALSERHINTFSNVEMIVAKIFLDTMLWCILYYEGKFMVTLSDASGEHELLDTNFPKVNNPHKSFPLSEYKDNGMWVKMSLLYSPLSSVGARKNTDLDALETGLSSDEDETSGSHAMTESNLKDNVKDNVFREGYHQAYFVRKPSRNTTRRNVFVRCGNWCYDGEVDLGQLSLTLSDVPMAIPILQAQQSSLRYVNEFNNLKRSNFYRKALLHLSHAAAFMEEQATSPEAVGALEQMEELGSRDGIRGDVGQKIAAGEAATEYFELQLSQNSSAFNNIEMAASKMYVRGVIIVMIYFDGSIYTTLADGEGDQPLLDVAFPDMSKKGGGCQIGTYDHPQFVKLCIWQGILSSKTGMGGGSKSVIKGIGMKQQFASPSMEKNSSLSVKKSGSGSVNCVSNGGQTYLVFKHGKNLSPVSRRANISMVDSQDPTKREAFFRFGSWCYSGRINFHVEAGQMTLYNASMLLPTVASQQKSMSFSTELSSLPITSKAYQALLRLEVAATFAVEQLINATEEIERLRHLLVSKGQKPWIDDGERNVYFELQLTNEGAAPMEEVETACSKIYVKGVLLSMIYVEKNIYLILDERDGEHALLDSTFPDISMKARGFTLGCNTNEYFKKFSVWEGSCPLNEPATGSNVKSSDVTRANIHNVKTDSDMVEGKVSHLGLGGNEGQKNGDRKEKIAKSSHLSDTNTKHLTLSRVKPPHRLAPLDGKRGGIGIFNGLKPLGKISMESPWDEYGKPRGMLLANRKK